ncbi:transcriptional repressor [Micrococcus flavus]|uniref:Fur family ferric uptake transcriptional regulator n=1 Tax=Micrococcus flavus TaxID=384602 RepID=A0A4Y8WYL8_9MICC|nr:Fur family transcriptional regulator [Micrococcus flavus]MBB4883741.1 Fur family ferric uptake transcriptional regulator [Micrococcus flavus]TFI00578.1 transcriptional repressor [Micrococcus flavus]GGK47953.1 transcriptional repressor [Micrococcus flavus]
MSIVHADPAADRALLRAAGLRVTRPRVAVLSALRSWPHADASSVLAAVRADLPQVSHQAVYDCLHVLTGAGLVRSLQPAGSAARYEIAAHDNHHHLVCRGCGTLVDVPCRTGSAPCLHAPEDHGFLIDEAEVYYWGLCPACRDGQDEAAPPSSSAAVP